MGLTIRTDLNQIQVTEKPVKNELLLSILMRKVYEVMKTAFFFSLAIVFIPLYPISPERYTRLTGYFKTPEAFEQIIESAKTEEIVTPEEEDGGQPQLTTYRSKPQPALSATTRTLCSFIAAFLVVSAYNSFFAAQSETVITRQFEALDVCGTHGPYFYEQQTGFDPFSN